MINWIKHFTLNLLFGISGLSAGRKSRGSQLSQVYLERYSENSMCVALDL